MLGKQRKNQANDLQFMESAWKNMAEILDQEMPVEKEERRIGWLSIAAILVMGFVGGITVMWGLQKHHSTPMAANRTINTTSEHDLVNTQSQKEESPILSPNNTTAYNSNPTLDKITITADLENTRNTSVAANIQKEQIIPKNLIQGTSLLTQKELSQNSVDQQISILPPSNLIELLPSEETIAAVEVSAVIFDKVKVDNATPLAELPTLGLTVLPSLNAGFTIDNDLDLPKNKKWRTGVYAGAIVAGKTNNGLEVGMRVERKLGRKWAIETGLGFRATQLALLSENEDAESLGLDNNDYQSITTSDPDSIARSISASQEIANRINADAPNYQLTIPLSLVYRPTGKLRLALGMSWAYRLNKLKDISSLDLNFDPAFEFLADGDINGDKNSFKERLDDFRLNFGVGYYLNPRTGIELTYSKGFSSIGSNKLHESVATNNDSSARFFQIGLTHYFGK